MRVVGKGDKEAVRRFADTVRDEFFVAWEGESPTGDEIDFELEEDEIDHRIFESASFINVEICIEGGAWTLRKPVGKGFVYEIN